MTACNIELAKKVLKEDSEVLYGIFGIIESSGYFPPRKFLNEFLLAGDDPCDQDGRMDNWKPFTLNAEEYCVIRDWWISVNPNTVVDTLSSDSWEGWVSEMLDKEMG